MGGAETKTNQGRREKRKRQLPKLFLCLFAPCDSRRNPGSENASIERVIFLERKRAGSGEKLHIDAEKIDFERERLHAVAQIKRFSAQSLLAVACRKLRVFDFDEKPFFRVSFFEHFKRFAAHSAAAVLRGNGEIV